MDISVGLIRKLDKVEPQLREVLLSILEEMEKQRRSLRNLLVSIGKQGNNLVVFPIRWDMFLKIGLTGASPTSQERFWGGDYRTSPQRFHRGGDREV